MISPNHSTSPCPALSSPHGVQRWCLRATLAAALLAACACATSRKWAAAAANMTGLADEIPTESQWNAVGLWQRVAENPPTYIPQGYSPTAPRDTQHGQWFTDERDGKKIFAPHSGANGFSGQVLGAEARKVTE